MAAIRSAIGRFPVANTASAEAEVEPVALHATPRKEDTMKNPSSCFTQGQQIGDQLDVGGGFSLDIPYAPFDATMRIGTIVVTSFSAAPTNNVGSVSIPTIVTLTTSEPLSVVRSIFEADFYELIIPNGEHRFIINLSGIFIPAQIVLPYPGETVPP